MKTGKVIDPMAASLTVTILFIVATASVSPAAAYTNHTVGGDAGWLFDLSKNTSATNYSAWAASQSFSLGDYLIFKTNSNQTVIQTYNETNYRSCSTDEDTTDGDTFQYGGGVQGFGQPMSIAVPLTVEGPNYYFSGANDGSQCQQGMAFLIDVQRGSGLPPYLNQPPPPPYSEPPNSPPATLDGDSRPQDNASHSLRFGALTTIFLLLLIPFF